MKIFILLNVALIRPDTRQLVVVDGEQGQYWVGGVCKVAG